MKTYKYTILAALAACGLASAAETAYTTPVGYITATIGGNASSSPAGAATYISPSLIQPASFAGKSTVSPSGGTTITFSGGVPTDLTGSSLLEISSGTQEGWWSTIVSSTATSITVADTFPAGLPAETSVSTRKFNTVHTIFGDNTVGLAAYDGVNPNDNIQLLNPIDQSTSTVIYADGWYDFVTEAPADDYIIYPGTSVKVVHRSTADLPLVTSGEVKLTKTQVDVYPRDNWLGQPNPTGGTLGSMNFAQQLNPNDFLVLLGADSGVGQGADTFVAVDGVMYNFVTEEEASGVPVNEGKGYVIKRDASDSASVITIPAQSVAQ